MKSITTERALNLFMRAVVITAISLPVYYGVTEDPPSCTKVGVVTDILELKYRSAVIEIDGNHEVTVNQASLKIGDDYCLSWKKH